jgi:SAM-dependent methyltransferase
MATERAYQGGELALFSTATNWKAYWAGKLAPFVNGQALEVGAGIGANAIELCLRSNAEWTLVEPDPGLCAQIQAKISDGQLPPGTRLACGVLRDLPDEHAFDTIVYIDVLEHIADDRGELAEAVHRLRAGGHLIVLAPAYQQLFSPFDAAIGHHRRYDRRHLLATAPSDMRCLAAYYLDSLGLLLCCCRSPTGSFSVRACRPRRRSGYGTG